MIIQQDQNHQLSVQQFAQAICQAMAQFKSLLLERSFIKTKIHILYRSNIQLTRIRSFAPVLTCFKGSFSHLTTQFILCPNEGIVEQQLKNLLLKSNAEISSLLFLNQLSLRQHQGKFMLCRQKGFIFRADIPSMRFFTDSRKLKLYLTHKIQRSYSLFSRQLQRLIVFLNPKLASATSKILMQQEQNFMMLKEVLERNRQFRPKSTKINLSGCFERTACEALDLAFNHLKIKRITPAQLLQSEKFFQMKASQINKKLTQSSSVILQGMRIKSVCKQETTICEGGFARISRGIFDIQLQSSVNAEFMEVVGQKSYFSLVRKQQKKSEYYHALLNQQLFLTFARNQRCSHIGRYYDDKTFNSSFKNGIYVEHYPRNLAQSTNLNEKQLLQNMTQIAESLSFLNDIGVAHRDLKLHNIMIDRNNRVKLIDFGSASPIIWTQKCRTSLFAANVDKRLASTEGYYLPYKDAAVKCVSLGDKFTKQEYECHQNFDIYSFGIILQKKFMLNLPVFGDFVREQLLFMSRKCFQPNPDDRITPLEAAIWLNCLQEYAWQRHCVWNHAERKAREIQKEEQSEQLKKQKMCQ